MNTLIGCALMPHHPDIIPEIGQEKSIELHATAIAMMQAINALKEKNPQTFVVITPHGPSFDDTVSISIHPRLKGNMAGFDAPDLVLGFETDGLLSRQIIKKCDRLGIDLVQLTDDLAKRYRIELQLDYGAFVPLYYVHKAGFKGQLVHLSIGKMSYEEMYTFGKAVQSAIGAQDKNVAVIASGNFSKYSDTQAIATDKYEYNYEQDLQLLNLIENFDIKSIFNLDRAAVAQTGECALLPAIFLLGVMGGQDMTSRRLSYEYPLGVGHAVIQFLHN